MKKLLLGLTVIALLGSCSEKGSKNKDNQGKITDSPVEAVTTQVEETQPSVDSIASETTNVSKKEETNNTGDPKYDTMLDKYQSLIDKCWKLSKKGLSINDQELADVWMEAGNMGNKINKEKKNLSNEQQSRLKDLDKSYKKFCTSQPS